MDTTADSKSNKRRTNDRSAATAAACAPSAKRLRRTGVELSDRMSILDIKRLLARLNNISDTFSTRDLPVYAQMQNPLKPDHLSHCGTLPYFAAEYTPEEIERRRKQWPEQGCESERHPSYVSELAYAQQTTTACAPEANYGYCNFNSADDVDQFMKRLLQVLTQAGIDTSLLRLVPLANSTGMLTVNVLLCQPLMKSIQTELWPLFCTDEMDIDTKLDVVVRPDQHIDLETVRKFYTYVMDFITGELGDLWRVGARIVRHSFPELPARHFCQCCPVYRGLDGLLCPPHRLIWHVITVDDDSSMHVAVATHSGASATTVETDCFCCVKQSLNQCTPLCLDVQILIASYLVFYHVEDDDWGKELQAYSEGAAALVKKNDALALKLWLEWRSDRS